MQSTNSILEIEKQRGIINEHEDSIHLLGNCIKLNENYQEKFYQLSDEYKQYKDTKNTVFDENLKLQYLNQLYK